MLIQSNNLYLLHKTLWQKGILSWKLHQGQKEIYEKLRSLDPKIQESLVFCARRFGKSTLGVIMALEDCLRSDQAQVRIIGPTIKQTIAIVAPILRKMTLDAPSGLIHRIKSEYRWRVGSSELIIGGFDGQNITRHLGQESLSIYLEESGAAKPEDFIYAVIEVLTPQLLHTRGRKIHLTTPPLQLNHPLVTQVKPLTESTNSYFHYTVFDNPLLNDTQIADAIRESGGVETAAFKRNYLCELVKDESSLAVPQYSDDCLFNENLLPYHQAVTVAGDLGGVRDKTCILLCTKHNSVLYVHDELVYPAQTESKKIFLDLFDKEKELQIKLQTPFWIDAPPAMTIDWNAQFKIIVAVPKKKQFDDMLTSLRQAFFRQEIRIANKCDFLKKSLAYGNLTSNRKDFERTESLGHCDGIAALAYAFGSTPETPANFKKPKCFEVQDKLVKALKEKYIKDKQNFDLFISGKNEMKNLFKKKR